MQSLQNKKQPMDEHIVRYWKDKMLHIKAYIKVYNFDIKIPEQL